MIDLAFLKRLIETIENSDIDSIEISRWATKIRISKTPPIIGGPSGNAFGSVPVSYRVEAGPAPAGGAEQKAPPSSARPNGGHQAEAANWWK